MVADLPNLDHRHFDVGCQDVKAVPFDRLKLILVVGVRRGQRWMFEVPESAFKSDADYARFVSLVSSHGRWDSRLRRLNG